MDDDPDLTLAQLKELAAATADRIAAEARARLAAERQANPPTVEQRLAEQTAAAKAVYQRARKRKYKPLPVTYQRKSK